MRAKELYQRVILDHNRNPRNFKKLDTASNSCDGYNPLCGDEMTLYIKLDGDTIQDISFTGSGCAISKASASMMTATLKGKTLEDSRLLFDEFTKMIKDELDTDSVEHHLGKLTILSGVKNYPSRVKCATLAWHTFICALDDNRTATTE